MKSLSLEQFYSKINKRLRLIAAYTEDEFIERIIKICRLKPLSCFMPGFKTNRAKLEKVWVDEFDNRLILKRKKLRLQSNCKRIPVPVTDIYRNQTFSFILRHSKLALLGIKDNCTIVIFWCSDNYLRCFRYENEWIADSPLIAGIHILKSFWSTSKLPVEQIQSKFNLKKYDNMEWFRLVLPAKLELIENNKIKELFTNEQ